MKIIFATHNNNKVKEVQALMPKGISLLGLGDVGFFEEIPENHPTLEGNALEKARTIYNKTGQNCFADDTGLEVEALNGEPGVKSARFAGEPSNSENNISLLLQKLNGKTNRKAQFRTVFALILNGQEHLFEGVANGHIIEDRKGHEGFGYDPVFVPEGHTQTFAEMPLGEKNKISHRAKALAKMISYLEKSGITAT